jgi:hypothetical protein
MEKSAKAGRQAGPFHLPSPDGEGGAAGGCTGWGLMGASAGMRHAWIN